MGGFAPLALPKNEKEIPPKKKEPALKIQKTVSEKK